MKVTRIRTLRAASYLFIKVETDEGLTGVGELHPASGTSGTPYTPIAALEYCAEYLIGKDPLHIERHWQHMFRRCIFRGGADTMSAIGAIDMALWDIKGKALGQPVYALLGGPTREKVRVYGHINGDTPEAMVDKALEGVEQGLTAIRLYPFGDFSGKSPNSIPHRQYAAIIDYAETCVRAVREAVGNNVDIMIDAVNRLTPPEAIAIGHALAPYHLYFFEDPIEPENMSVWQHVAAQMPVPIAMGERLYTIHQFQELLQHKGAAYIRPDIALAGGITNVKKIAALAEAHHVGVVPHNPLSGVFTAACVQLDAAVHNIAVQEYSMNQHLASALPLIKEPIKYEAGYLIVPNTPGLGVELNEEAFRHYPPTPYDRSPLIGPDGGLRDY